MNDSIQLISNSKIQRGEQLGQGSFGIVYKGTWQGHQVAIKVLHASKLPQKLEEQFQREAQIMAKLLNPAIIRLYGICQENNTYAMVMELMPKGDLYAFLNDQKQNIPWNPLRWQLAIDIASGLKYLHERKIFHRDLKSPNILLDHKLRAKITDFGLSRVKLHTSTLHTQNKGGSYPWMAPELFDDETNTKVTDKIDIYAYGIVLWEIAARKHPFASVPNQYVIPIKIMQGKRETIPEGCPIPFAQLINKCWSQAPEDRPTTSGVLTFLQKAKPQGSKETVHKLIPSLEKSTLSSPLVKVSSSNQKRLDVETWQLLKALKNNTYAHRIAHLGGGIIATASSSNDTTINIWNTQNSKCLKTLITGHTHYINSLVHLDEGIIASGSYDKTIKIWNTQNSKCLKTLKGHSKGVSALARIDNGIIASGSYDRTIKIWNTQTGKCLKTLTGHSHSVEALEHLGTGKIASGSYDKTIKIWDTKAGTCLQTLTGHSHGVNTLAYIGNGIIASAARKKTIKIWNIQTGTCIKVLEGHSDEVMSLIHLGNGIIASGSRDSIIKIWDTKLGVCLKTLTNKLHNGMVVSLVYISGGKLVSGAYGDCIIKIWGNP